MLSRIPNTTELDSLQNIQLVTLTQVGESKHSESRRCRFLFSSCVCTIAEGCNQKSVFIRDTGNGYKNISKFGDPKPTNV